MAPFPGTSSVRSRTSLHSSQPGDTGGVLPLHSPNASMSSSHAYPPINTPPRALSPTASGQQQPMGAGETPQQRLQRLDPKRLFGQIKAPTPVGGILRGGIGGITQDSTETVRRCLEENHLHSHTFFNDKGFHNHCSHHLLAAYSLGASPALLQDILELHRETASKPMPTIAPIEINESNWTHYLGDERYYPNYLAFFHRIISAPPAASSPYADKPTSVVPVLEQYLFGGKGQMLVRAVSGALHPLIHIGHGIEFGLDGHVAEGLAQCAVHKPQVAALFPSEWPPQPPRSTSLASSITSAFSSLRFGGSSSNTATANGHSTVGNTGLPYFHSMTIASPDRSFARTVGNLPRGPGSRRYPREGLSGFTILSRILHDDSLAPGNANSLSDSSKLDGVVRNRASRIAQWCEEWRFSTEERVEWDDPQDAALSDGGASRRGSSATNVNAAAGPNKGKGRSMAAPPWDEIVEKTEELVWMATVIYAAAARPGYKDIKLDFFLMHGLTSVLFLPSMLEVISPHLRPYLLMSHFRLVVAYWVSRGRPELYISEGLMAAPAYPAPPPSTLHPENRPKASAVRRALDRALNGGQGDEDDDEHAHRREPDLDSPEYDESVNPWMKVLQSAADHDDEHVTKVVRSLYWAATQFGSSPKGMFTSGLPGTEDMDGTIFIRAAGLTLTSIGWAHEGDSGRPGTWDRSALGFPSTWADDELLPGHEWPPVSFTVAHGGDRKGKSRSSNFNLSSMPPAHAIEYGYQYESGSGNGGGERRSRSGTIVPNSASESTNAAATTTTATLPPLQPPLSVAIDYSGGIGGAGGASAGASNGGHNWSTSHSRSASAASITSSAYRPTSYGGHGRQPSASGSGFHSPGMMTPTGTAAGGGRSPTGSVYGGVSSPIVREDPYLENAANANANAEAEAAHRSGWRKFGEETTEEELERRKLEEEDRELMG